MQTSADAVTTSVWQNTSLGDWFLASNWSSAIGVPTASIEARIGNGGTALISAPSAQAEGLFIGAPTTTGSSGALLLGASGGNTGFLTVASDIHIGYSNTTGFVGNGSVTISAGAALQQQSGNFNIGEGAQGSTGSLTITDPNSFMTTAAPTYIGLGNSHGSLTVQNGAQMFTGPAELADGISSSGAATVTGSNSVWAVKGGFTVGYAGSGTLTVSSGGKLPIEETPSTFSDVSVAALAGSTGSVTVTGAGSVWYTGNLFLGGRDDGGAGIQGGNGSLNITSGGLVQADNVKFFGGALQVDNGSLNTPGLRVVGGKTFPSYGGPVGDMVVGNTTTGRMEIVNGGFLFCNKGYVGIVSGSEGYVLVDDGEWVMTGSLFVANQGDGTLEISGIGGRATTHGNAYIGFSPNTVGNVIVGGGNSGSDALLNVVGDLYIGGNTGGAGGSGVLRVNDYGAVLANTATVYSTGGLAIGGSNGGIGSPITFLGGFIQFVTANNTIFPNDCTLGTGGVQVYTSGHPSTLGGKLSGGGGLRKGGGGSLGFGTLTLTGASNYTGATAVTAGTLLVNGSITSPVTVSSGATLGGNGAVGTVTVNSGGIVAPGNSPGKLTVNGNYEQTSGATLKIELGGTTAGSGFDQIAASGIASLGGILDVNLVNGFRPNIGDTFQIITSNGESGTFSTVSSRTGLTVRADVSSTGVVLTVIGIDPLLRIISIARNGSDILITYDATGGKTYRLERKAALSDANWLAITGVNDQTPLANGPATFTDPGALALGKAFYRVSLLPAPGVNLLVNGNAEAGAFSATGAPIAVPGWTTSSAFTVINYKPAGDTSGFPKTTDAGPPDRANQFFAGGNAATSTATQTIDVSANAADIDTGSAVVDLSGWLGGFATDGDNASLSVAFFNGSTNLGGGAIGPVTNVDRGNVTSLLSRSQTIPVSANTRQLVVTLRMDRTDGAFNDGYADSLSVVLRVP
jgi:T5SS/PEP-CTERM-associated repeat protein/autotransporter-associated beta strand protein